RRPQRQRAPGDVGGGPGSGGRGAGRRDANVGDLAGRACPPWHRRGPPAAAVAVLLCAGDADPARPAPSAAARCVAGLRRRVAGTGFRPRGPAQPRTWAAPAQAVTGVQGRWAEAEVSYREVLEARRRLLGETHGDTLITHHELGWAIARQGRISEA